MRFTKEKYRITRNTAHVLLSPQYSLTMLRCPVLNWLGCCAEEKFKRVKLGNAKIKAALVDVPGAVDALLAIGWLREQEPEEALVVPKGCHFSMAEASAPLTLQQMTSNCCPIIEGRSIP